MPFSHSEAIHFGYKRFKKHWQIILLTTIVYVLIISAISMLSEEAGKTYTKVILWIVASWLDAGFIIFGLKIVDSKKAQLGDLFSGLKFVVRYALATVVYILAVVTGLFLLIIPGIYLAIKYQFYSEVIIDKDVGIMDSFSQSTEITNGRIWWLFRFGILLFLLNIAGVLAAGVGLLATIPISYIAYLHVYRKLEKARKE